MSGVQILTISEDEGEQRLDRWLKRRFPQLTQGNIEKMCRTGQLRVDGGRIREAFFGEQLVDGVTVRPLLGFGEREELGATRS